MGDTQALPPAPSALIARHASEADDEIQLTTKPRSHHSALRGQATAAKCAGRSTDPGLAHTSWMVTRCLTPTRTGRSAEAGPEMASTQASARFGNLLALRESANEATPRPHPA
jgi:hypothetical protein